MSKKSPLFPAGSAMAAVAATALVLTGCGQRAGKIDLASYGPFSYIIAKDGGVPIEPLAAPVNAPGDAPAYTSLAYVKAGSDITSLDQAKGKKVCFVDAASTSGFLVPTKGLMDVGTKADITPVMAGGLFWADERVVFTGSRYITRRRAALPCWESGARHAGELPIL
jgi:ABC-type phosphate/phosphonate transport system substrate-binding protein